MPSWVGDAVMATPTLRALRQLYPDAHITALIRREIRPIIDACPWLDRIVCVRKRQKGSSKAGRNSTIPLAARLAKAEFDTAVLLPNSFRTALLVRMAKIKRRVGYDRDGRGFLLTDRLLARRGNDGFVPVPARDYYLGIANYLGAVDSDPALKLFTRPEDEQRATQLLESAGVTDPQRPLVLINPGANYGDAKMWYPDRFAEVADRCVRQHNAYVAVTGAPKERKIIDSVVEAAKEPMIDLTKLGIDLTLLKSIVARSRLMVTNDTGPRHIAVAMNVPVVTVFGPTDPIWSEIDFELERKVSVDVFCGPCQKKRCPLDHRCMTLVSPDMVFQRAEELLSVSVNQTGIAAEKSST